MSDPMDVKALIERLRGYCPDDVIVKDRMWETVKEAADALEAMEINEIALLSHIERLKAELAEERRERILAEAHDRQPYPTAEAYERACAVRDQWKAKFEAARARLIELDGGYQPNAEQRIDAEIAAKLKEKEK
jgi:hypothetical protein